MVDFITHLSQSVYGEEKQVYDYTPDDDVSDVNAQSMDLQSLSSLTTPVILTEGASPIL